jgi:dihydrofolate reductase
MEEVKSFLELDLGIPVFIIGGGMIYRELLPYCQEVYLTRILKDHDNVDTYFPNLDEMEEWVQDDCSETYDYNGVNYQYQHYRRH